MGKRQRIARLEAAVMDAKRALEGSDVAHLQGAASELLSALVDEFDRGHELGAPKLHDRMVARLEELEVAALQRTLTACPCCRGTELLVSRRDHTPIEGLALEITLVVCRSCGDVRMRHADPAALARLVIAPTDIKVFRTITVPARDPGPFR